MKSFTVTFLTWKTQMNCLRNKMISILHPFTEHRWEEQKDTWLWLEKTIGLDNVVNRYTGGSAYDYYNLVYTHLNKYEDKPFCIIEQDIVPSADLFFEMIDCPFPLCSAPYRLFPESTLLPKPEYSCRIVTASNKKNPLKLRWITEQDTRADFYSLGFTKFNPMSISDYNPAVFHQTNYLRYELKPTIWSRLDHEMSNITWKHGLQAHLHFGQITHNHK